MATNEGRHIIIKLVVFPFDVMVSIDETDDVLLKRLIRNGNSREDCISLLSLPESTMGRCGMLPSNQTVIRLISQPTRLDMISLISHEVFHAVSFILDRIGIKLEISVSDETYAYLIQYLTTEIHRRLKT